MKYNGYNFNSDNIDMKKIKIKKIKMIGTSNLPNMRIVKESFRYKDVKIPKGFVTIGLNLPHIFDKIIRIDVFNSEYSTSIVLHDFLYYSGMDKHEADKMFLQFCKETKLKFSKCMLIYILLNIFSGKRYRNRIRRNKTM